MPRLSAPHAGAHPAACGRLALTQTPALTLAFARRRSSCGLWTTRPYPNPSPNPSLRTQALILRLVDEYSAVTAITVTTLRKAGTLAASFALFPKPLSLGHPIGAALVLCSAFVKANLCCRRRRMLEAALLPAVHAAAARRSRGPPACSGLLYAPGPRSEPSPVGCRCGAAAALSRLAKVTEPTAFDHPGTDAMTSRARALRRVSSTTCCPSRMVAMLAAEVAHLDARPPRACMFTRCYFTTVRRLELVIIMVFASLWFWAWGVPKVARVQRCPTEPPGGIVATKVGYFGVKSTNVCRDTITFSTKPAKVGQRRHQEGSAGTKSGSRRRARAPWSCSPCWRPSSRTARFRDQLQLDDEANSEIAR